MKTYITKLEAELKKTQEDLLAVKFTPQSVTGKQLMSKCRLLYEENEEFGLQVSEGRIHQLQCEVALNQEYAKELRESLDESNLLVMQLDQEIETLEEELTKLKKIKGEDTETKIVEDQRSNG